MPKYAPPPDPQLRDQLRSIARQMRHEPTLAESLLWQRLRHRQICGYRFHRQHRVDRFIVDFVCLRPGLVIEVDGEVHQHQIEADLERERILKGLGYRVVRFTNAQVIDHIDEVLQKILLALS